MLAADLQRLAFARHGRQNRRDSRSRRPESALGKEIDVRAPCEGDCLGDRVGTIAAFDRDDQLTAAMLQLPGQGEFHPQLAAVIGLGNLLKDGLVVHLGGTCKETPAAGLPSGRLRNSSAATSSPGP